MTAVGDWACVGVFGFADGTHEQHVLLEGSETRCQALAHLLDRATSPEAVDVPRGDGSIIKAEQPKRLLRYPGERVEPPIGAVVAVVPRSQLEEPSGG